MRGLNGDKLVGNYGYGCPFLNNFKKERKLETSAKVSIVFAAPTRTKWTLENMLFVRFDLSELKSDQNELRFFAGCSHRQTIEIPIVAYSPLHFIFF